MSKQSRRRAEELLLKSAAADDEDGAHYHGRANARDAAKSAMMPPASLQCRQSSRHERSGRRARKRLRPARHFSAERGEIIRLRAQKLHRI